MPIPTNIRTILKAEEMFKYLGTAGNPISRVTDPTGEWSEVALPKGKYLITRYGIVMYHRLRATYINGKRNADGTITTQVPTVEYSLRQPLMSAKRKLKIYHSTILEIVKYERPG